MMRFLTLGRVALVAVLLLPLSLQGAELKNDAFSRPELEGGLNSPGSTPTGIVLPAIDPYRTRLLQAVATLREVLTRLEPDVETAWLRYLRLDEVEQGLAASPPQRVAVLASLRERLRADVQGLETDEVVALRDAAYDYEIQLRLRSGNAAATIRDAIAALQEAAVESDAGNQVDPLRLAHAAELLHHAGYVPEWVAAVRNRWSHPNVVIRAETKFISKFIERDIAETSMQSAVILGTSTRGPSSTIGRLELASVPNDRAAQLQLRMNGSSRSSRNVGHNGPAVIYSSSASQFRGGKTLFIDPVWGVSSSPAWAGAQSSIGIKRIDIEPPVLPTLLQPAFTRAAWNKARQSQDAAESEVERLTERRIQQRIESEMAEPLKKAQNHYHEHFFIRQLRFDEVPTISSRSTAEYIELAAQLGGRGKLAAPTAAPEFDPATKLGATLHQSAFTNTSCRALIESTEQTDEQIEHYSQFIAMQVPPELRVHSNSVPWSLTLDLERPNTFRFDAGKIDLTIHTTAWTIDGRRFERKIDLRVVYRVENSPLGMTFVRVGEPIIQAVDGRPWSADEQSLLVPHITEKFHAMFQEKGRFNSLILPKGDGFGPFGSITLKQLECDNGWLLLGYQ